jgi:predicted ArsR family transcriptional regulator
VSDLQREARALGDPTRHRLFRQLVALGRPAGVAELTEAVGVHHNAVRQHLAQLVEAGLVEESTAEPTGRGRPRLQYEAAPAARRWAGVGPYEWLSTKLAEIIRTGDDPVAVGRRAGLEEHRGAERGATSDGASRRRPSPVDPVEVLADEMARHGFDPVVQRRGRQVTLVLGACPFVTTALADPDTVCSLHLGLARGVAEAVGGLVVDELDRRDPRRARCRLRCHLEQPGAQPSVGATAADGAAR